ncbi:MAG: DUF167 domain-containing protein [Acidimicrobiia bacterium]
MEGDLITPGIGGVYVDIHVQPGAKHPGVKGRHGAVLKIAVAARAVDGKANRAAIQAVANLLAVLPGDVTIVSGHTSRRKRLFLKDVAFTEAQSRIESNL